MQIKYSLKGLGVYLWKSWSWIHNQSNTGSKVNLTQQNANLPVMS